LAVNLTSISHPALWRDEVATIVAAQRSPSAIVALLRHDDAPLGAYYLFMHFWIKISESALWLRLPSAVAAAVTVVFLFLLARQLVSTSVGIVAGLVHAVLPFGTRFAQEARPYALVMCGATAASWLFVRALRQSRHRLWRAYSIVLAATVALQVMAVTLIDAQLVTLVLANRRRYGRYLPWLISILPPTAIAVFIGIVTAGDSTTHTWIPKSHLRTPYDAAIELAGSRTTLDVLFGIATIGACAAAWIFASR
jgi:mannosyltransferase